MDIGLLKYCLQTCVVTRYARLRWAVDNAVGHSWFVYCVILDMICVIYYLIQLGGGHNHVLIYPYGAHRDGQHEHPSTQTHVQTLTNECPTLATTHPRHTTIDPAQQKYTQILETIARAWHHARAHKCMYFLKESDIRLGLRVHHPGISGQNSLLLCSWSFVC